MLAAPFISLGIVVLLRLTAPASMGAPADVAPGSLLLFAIAAVLWLTGTAWMFRVAQGPRDAPPAGRHRRH
jgi:hypothetical protein